MLEPFDCKCYELCRCTCPRTRVVSFSVLSGPSRPIISGYVGVFYDPIQKLLQNITETIVDSLIVGARINFRGSSPDFIDTFSEIVRFWAKLDSMIPFYIRLFKCHTYIYNCYIKFALEFIRQSNINLICRKLNSFLITFCLFIIFPNIWNSINV